MVDENMLSETSFTMKSKYAEGSYKAAMKEHVSWEFRSASEDQAGKEELESEGESGDDDADALRTDMSAREFRNEIERLTTSEVQLRSTNTQLTQHVNVQGKCLQAKERDINELGDKCDVMVEFAKWLPAEVRDEALLTFESAELLQQIMDTYTRDIERKTELAWRKRLHLMEEILAALKMIRNHLTR
jgi:hypothetical protein